MRLKQNKIKFLIDFILIFFFPYILFASVQTLIKTNLQKYGFIVKEIGKVSILLPNKDISLKINNLQKLHKGFNKAHITFFYHNQFYANADIDIRLDQKDILPDIKKTDYSIIPSGKTVTIVYKTGNLIIRSEGVLTESKSVSDFVKVRSKKFNKVLEGILIDSNTVLIP